MASVARRPDGQWRARYRDPDGREHSKHFARRVDAQRWLDEVGAAIVTGAYVHPQAGRRTVADYAGQWQAGLVAREASLRIVDNALRLHALPVLGARPLGSVRRSDVQALVKSLSATYSPGQVRNVYDTLARMFGAATDDRLIAESPCRRITLPAASDHEVTPPTAEQVAALVEAVEPRYRAAVVLLAGSGLRIGELLGLEVADVDFLRRTVRVERQRLQNGALGPPKTSRSARTVPLGGVVLEALAEHLRQWPGSGTLFLTPEGKPLEYRAWKRVWGRAQTATGLEVGTHDLRHFTASALIAGGASVKQVQTVLGHGSAVITLRTYAHLWPGDDDRTRSVMDAVLDVLRTGCGPSVSSASVTAGQTG